MSASRGTPVVAIESGAVYRLSTSSLGGISVYLIGSFAFYVNSEDALDFPMGGEIGLQYRF